MSKRYYLLGLLALVAFTIVGCNRSSALPACEPEDLVAPVQDLPGQYFHIGTDSTTSPIPTEIMTWEEIGCRPEHFKVTFSPERDFGIARQGMTDGETWWPVTAGGQAPLQPATEYFWNVRAWSGGVNGPPSSTRMFFTGPLCGSTIPLASPELLSPESGSVIEALQAELHYKAGGSNPCVPEGYFIDLQTDPDFGGTTLLAEYGITGTYVFTDELQDCTTYYWRVAAHQGGERGPFSEVRSFTTSVAPTCAAELAPPELPGGLAELDICTPEDLTAPVLTLPLNNSYVGTSVTETPLNFEFFQWQSLDCLPDEYRIQYSKDRYFSSYMTGSAAGNQTSWPTNPQPSLDEATRYYWRVYAVVDGVAGPESDQRYFFTGPQCSGVGDLGPPDLLTPLDGQTISENYAELHFRPGSWACLPQGYLVDMQTASDFSGTNLLGEYDWPGTYLFADELADCSTYYWRVAALSNGSPGPYSEERSFSVDLTGNCPLTLARLPEVEALRDLACYVGPNPAAYEVAGYLLAGETAEVVAQNLAETWWVIQNPDGFDTCYVPKDGTRGGEGAEDIPRWNDPVIETDEPEPESLTCSKDLSQDDCTKAGGTWEDSPAAMPYCKCD